MCSGTRAEHINTRKLCGQNVELLIVKLGRMYSNYRILTLETDQMNIAVYYTKLLLDFWSLYVVQ